MAVEAATNSVTAPFASSTLSAVVSTSKVASLLPASMVTVSLPSSPAATKSRSPPASSPTVRFTVSAAVVAPARFTVKLAAVPSVTAAPASMVTAGSFAVSSSLIVTVALAGLPAPSVAGSAPNVRVRVSLDSMSLSSVMGTSKAALVFPALMVTL